jgi:hypothetical protein
MALSRNIRAGTQAASLDYDARKENLLAQLRGQYDAVVGVEPRFAYSGRKSDLTKIFESQAVNLARKGVNDLTELGQSVDDKGKKTLINKNTGEELFKIVRDPDIKVDKWAEKGKNVKGIAAFSVKFDEEGRGLFLPVYEESTAFGGPLADLVVPLATIAGAYFLGPVFASSLGASGGAAAGAAIGSSGGQLAATGEIDPMKTLLSAGTAYVGSELFGGGAPAPEAAPVDATLATSTPVPGSFQATLPELGVRTAATTPAFTAVPGSFGAALPSLITPVNVIGDTAQGLLNQDLEFVGADAEQLYDTTGSVAATQQNLIAAGVDPTMAAEASNLAALGGNATTIASNLGTAFPGEAVFTSEGLLSGGATLDDFAKKIGGNITSSAAGITGAEVLRNLSRLSKLSGLLSDGGPGSSVGGSLTGGTPGRGVSYNLPSFAPTRINLPSFAPMVDLGLTEQQIQGLLSQPNPLPSFSLLR